MTTEKLNLARSSCINANTIEIEKSFSSFGPVFVFFVFFIVVVFAHLMVGWSVEREETGDGGVLRSNVKMLFGPDGVLAAGKEYPCR